MAPKKLYGSLGIEVIISVSRRTDIPAFFGPWFVRRLKAGYADVQNPMNEKQVSRILLNSDTADCFVFCTKNPLPMIRGARGHTLLDAIDPFEIPYIFHITLNPYGNDIEANLPPKSTLLEAFAALSRRIGSERMVWRYDPVVFGGIWDVERHKTAFSAYAKKLAGYTTRCIVSFFMIYRKFSAEKIQGLGGPIGNPERLVLARHFMNECRQHGMRLSICCDACDYSALGIDACGCIDKNFVETVLNCSINPPKEKSLRDNCLCLPSVDVGAYDSCPHGCAYCYATSTEKNVKKRMRMHDTYSSMLIGHVPPDVEPVIRAMPSIKIKQRQLTLFQ